MSDTSYGKTKRFVFHAVAFDSDACLLWPFSGVGGYGTVYHEGKRWLAHRLVCTLVHGAAPEDKPLAAHSCGKGHLGCVNPKHLRWATPIENRADMVGHGTAVIGEKNPAAKLSRADVAEIIALRGKETCRSIAARFGVSRSQVSDIQTGKAWARAAA